MPELNIFLAFHVLIEFGVIFLRKTFTFIFEIRKKEIKVLLMELSRYSDLIP